MKNFILGAITGVSMLIGFSLFITRTNVIMGIILFLIGEVSSYIALKDK